MSESQTAEAAEKVETVADLVEQSPVVTRDADLKIPDGDLRVGDSKLWMGLCTGDEQLARGLRQRVFRTGPYRVEVIVDSRKRDGPQYRITADERGAGR